MDSAANERGEVEAFLSGNEWGGQLLDALAQANLNLSSVSLQDIKSMCQSLHIRQQHQRIGSWR
jgi:hypothetical protein